MVYYRYLFLNMEELSPNEGLVYSALLSHSLMVSEFFDLDGKFCPEYAKAAIQEHIEECSVEYIEYQPLSVNRLAKHLEMTRNSVRKILQDLRNKYRLFTDEIILCPSELIDAGYIDIPSGTKLKGLQLVYYGLLKDRSSLYRRVIDTWAYRLAELAGIDKKAVYNLLTILHKKGFVVRRDDGKLRIL